MTEPSKRKFVATKTPWTKQDIEALRKWHEERLTECNYPAEVRNELSEYRENFIMKLGRWMKKE